LWLLAFAQIQQQAGRYDSDHDQRDHDS
jgi:hypothetical protein